MSIIKDLINISLMIMLLFVLYKTNNGSVAIVCATLVMLLYCLKYIRLNNMIQQAIDKEALKQQQFFTEVLAHDLKTPTLAQLRGLELIQNEIVGTISKEQQELVEQIKESCKYVLDMISQIIRIYNIEHGLQKIVYEKVNMEEILLKSFENVDSAAKEKGVEFVYLASGIDTVLEAVQKDIKIVITNMLMNAIVYSNAGEKIFIKFEKISNSLKFEIITKGLILSETECKNMFNSIYSNMPKYAIIGHGINLYLCKIIADCYKGKIYAETDGEIYNKFTLELPSTQYSGIYTSTSLLASY